jgi:hypothetical protein
VIGPTDAKGEDRPAPSVSVARRADCLPKSAGVPLQRPGDLVAIRPPKQLRQPRDVDGDPPRLILRQDLGLPCFGIVVAAVEVGEGLRVAVPDNIAARVGSARHGAGKRRDGSDMAALSAESSRGQRPRATSFRPNALFA